MDAILWNSIQNFPKIVLKQSRSSILGTWPEAVRLLEEVISSTLLIKLFESIIMIASKYLKDSMHNIQKLAVIPALKKFETKDLGKILRLSKLIQYEDGEVIIQESDIDPCFYFLLSGTIRIVKDQVTIGTISKMGEIFGEMRILDKLSRSASVYAKGKTICLAVNTAATHRFSSDDETTNFLLLLYKIFAEYISTRLRLTNEELIKTKKQLEVLTKKMR